MIRRLVLCEGPEDIAAVRALADGHFGWDSSNEGASPEKRFLSVGEERAYNLVQSDVLTVELRAVPGAKSAALAAHFGDVLSNNFRDGQVEHVAVLFDPDTDTESAEFARLQEVIDAKRGEWQVARQQTQAHVAQWSFERRPSDRVTVHAIPWRCSGPLVDALEDAQNLERLECEILTKAFPGLTSVVARWINEMRDAHGCQPTWKTAIHLWCALVEPKQSTATFAERVLHQQREWRAHAKDALSRTTLVDDLRPLLGR